VREVKHGGWHVVELERGGPLIKVQGKSKLCARVLAPLQSATPACTRFDRGVNKAAERFENANANVKNTPLDKISDLCSPDGVRSVSPIVGFRVQVPEFLVDDGDNNSDDDPDGGVDRARRRASMAKANAAAASARERREAKTSAAAASARERREAKTSAAAAADAELKRRAAKAKLAKEKAQAKAKLEAEATAASDEAAAAAAMEAGDASMLQGDYPEAAAAYMRALRKRTLGPLRDASLAAWFNADKQARVRRAELRAATAQRVKEDAQAEAVAADAAAVEAKTAAAAHADEEQAAACTRAEARVEAIARSKLFAALGLEANAATPDVKRAFRRGALANHPDRLGHGRRRESVDAAAARFHEQHAAYVRRADALSTTVASRLCHRAEGTRQVRHAPLTPAVFFSGTSCSSTVRRARRTASRSASWARGYSIVIV
jgi:hypothetical protein